MKTFKDIPYLSTCQQTSKTCGTVTPMIKLIVFVSLFNLSKKSMFVPKKIFVDSVYKDAPKAWFEYVREFIHKILGDKFNYSRYAPELDPIMCSHRYINVHFCLTIYSAIVIVQWRNLRISKMAEGGGNPGVWHKNLFFDKTCRKLYEN